MNDLIVTAPPKSVQVAELIRKDIENGHLKSGDRLVPLRKLAEKFSVANWDVQRAFEILRNEGVIESHVGRGTFVASETGLLMKKTVILVLMGTSDKHNILPTVLSSTLQTYGFISYLFAGENNDRATVANLKSLLAAKPRALVVDANSAFNFSILDTINPETQLVMVRGTEAPKDYGASFIREDFAESCRCACHYLLEKGRKKIAVVSWPLGPDPKIPEIEQALNEKGLKVFKYIANDIDNTTFIEEFGKNGCPDGVFCLTDFNYVKVRMAAAKYNLVNKRDFDAIGNGNTPWAEAFGIASIDRNFGELSKEVAKALVKGERVDIKIPPKIVEHDVVDEEQLKIIMQQFNQTDLMD